MALLTKADFTTHLYAEIINSITRNNDAVVTKAIEMAEQEAMAYLNRYDKATMFGGSFNNPLLKDKVLDIAAWKLVKLANPNVSMELLRTLYEDAVKFFTNVMKGNVEPDGWPYRADDPDTPVDEKGHIYSTSNPKRNNHY